MQRRILVTGGLGFIGSNFIRYVLDRYDYKIINLDKITYCGRQENLKDIENNQNYKFIKGDIGNIELMGYVISDLKPDVVVNFAAESHNDRAIEDPYIFIKTII